MDTSACAETLHIIAALKAATEALGWHIIPFPFLSHSVGPNESDLPIAGSLGIIPDGDTN